MSLTKILKSGPIPLTSLATYFSFRGEFLTNGVSVEKDSFHINDKEAIIVVNGGKIEAESGSSDSENESGFLEKMKDKVADAIGV